MVCRRERLCSAEMGEAAGNIMTWLADIAHDGHHGVDAMKRYLRARLWYPGMDGPTNDGKHLLVVVVDLLSRYPEVEELVSVTSRVGCTVLKNRKVKK